MFLPSDGGGHETVARRDTRAERRTTNHGGTAEGGCSHVASLDGCGKPLALTLEPGIFLFLASIVGGALNAVAAGGSCVAFPASLFTGVPPIPANATNTLALWSGPAASGGAYRNRLDVPVRVMLPLLITSLIGGIAGAVLLLRTPAHTFLRVLPWLMLGATL